MHWKCTLRCIQALKVIYLLDYADIPFKTSYNQANITKEDFSLHNNIVKFVKLLSDCLANEKISRNTFKNVHKG